MRETLHEVAAAIIFALLTWGWRKVKGYRKVAERNHQRLDVLWRDSGFEDWNGTERRINDRRAHVIDYTGPERRVHQRRKGQ